MYGTLLTLLCVLLLTLQTAVSHERRRRHPSGAARRYCGDQLTNSLSLLCNGYYKRVSAASNYLEYEESAADEETESSVFRQRKDGLSMTRDRKFRQRRGVASECCHKACTLSELTTYCGKLEE